ncbi:hypothetical protein K0H71_15345 [Bacillus sp. IITD106]|nr:hypothetical protein [Bacillus sp. IITD106]
MCFLKTATLSNTLSKAQRDHEGIHLRVIDDEKPDANAVNIQPNLEDVFLYYSGDGERW